MGFTVWCLRMYVNFFLVMVLPPSSPSPSYLQFVACHSQQLLPYSPFICVLSPSPIPSIPPPFPGFMIILICTHVQKLKFVICLWDRTWGICLSESGGHLPYNNFPGRVFSLWLSIPHFISYSSVLNIWAVPFSCCYEQYSCTWLYKSLWGRT